MPSLQCSDNFSYHQEKQSLTEQLQAGSHKHRLMIKHQLMKENTSKYKTRLNLKTLDLQYC